MEAIHVKISNYLLEDDYIQVPIMKRFIRDNNICALDTRADGIKAIEEFANKNKNNEDLVNNWINRIVKEGSKEICYHKLTNIPVPLLNPASAKTILETTFSECPMQDILHYQNTDSPKLIRYDIIQKNNETQRICLTYSNKFLKRKDNDNNLGDTTIYPVFIEIYISEGFIISRAKAKSTLYKYTPENAFLIRDNKIDTMDHACSIMDSVIHALNLSIETSPQKEACAVANMLFKVYNHFSFTPNDITDKINSQNNIITSFTDSLFKNLNLDARNKSKALSDIRIVVEKYISINGDNEDIFKKDRDAYLIKITSDDEMALTKTDTSSNKTVPLQCTEAFFDSKKSVLSSKKCNRLHLVFKRTEKKFFPVNNQLVVQLGIAKNHGYIKTMQYAEEEDLQNVFQTIFKNY